MSTNDVSSRSPHSLLRLEIPSNFTNSAIHLCIHWLHCAHNGQTHRAFQKRPGGFARYADNVNSFTSRVNKYLRENNLIETGDHSLYSFRHSFQDRLTALEVGHRMECELMGHAFRGEKYGDGPTLEHKRRVLQKSAFIVTA